MPLLGFNSADYFKSLNDTGAAVAAQDRAFTISSSSSDVDPGFTLADAPYSATNAATVPTVSVASPFSNLKQWSLDSTGEYTKMQAASATPASQYLIYAAVAVALLLVFKKR